MFLKHLEVKLVSLIHEYSLSLAVRQEQYLVYTLGIKSRAARNSVLGV